MTELGIIKRRLAALVDAINELENISQQPEEIAPVDVKQELNKLSLDELKEISNYITERMVWIASGKLTDKKGTRMPLAVKQNMVNKYLDEGDADQSEKDWYRSIEAKKSRDRNDDEKKKFIEFRNRAQKWFEERYPANKE